MTPQHIRRDILVLLSGLFISFYAVAEPTKVGMIVFNPVFMQAVEGFKQGMEQAGMKENQDVVYTIHDIGRDMNKVEGIFNEMVANGTDLIFSTTTPIALKLKQLTANQPVPVVFSMVASPTESRLVNNLQKPGGNLSGISHLAFESLPKRLQLFKKAFPDMKRIAAFYNPKETFLQGYLERHIYPVAKELDVDIVEIPVISRDELEQKGKELTDMRIDGIFMQPDPQSAAMFDLLAKASRQHKLPLMVVDNSMLGAAGVIGYSPSFAAVGQQAGAMAAKVISGSDIGDQPVLNPAKVELVISVREAKKLGLRPGRASLRSADRIIR